MKKRILVIEVQDDTASFRTRKPYERMVAVATRFKTILEENGL